MRYLVQSFIIMQHLNVARSLSRISSFANSVVTECRIEYADAHIIFSSLNSFVSCRLMSFVVSATGPEARCPYCLKEVFDHYLSFSVSSPEFSLMIQRKGI
ncbi:MAG: hypothetical protein EZS28_011973 [Streblomastix strix]|uniref:Uncharacterized protein n=1 Tax=Streblomastix strix TaxID=222440 RepID=A0A5J4WC15_9EUKA|nr:MAG: hypothetical protein EZS28_011973 [Streblomastix strix]